MYKNFNKYEVFEDGRIWSYPHKKFLKPTTTREGYQRVGLMDNDGKRHFQYVHRVTWIAVNGREILEGMQINHKDEDKTNNHISNLELCTPKENLNYGTHNERVAKALSKRVGAFKDGELVMVFPSTKEAQRNGYHSGHISACCNGKLKHHKDYEWKFLEE